jgi:hypothetical protein
MNKTNTKLGRLRFPKAPRALPASELSTITGGSDVTPCIRPISISPCIRTVNPCFIVPCFHPVR